MKARIITLRAVVSISALAAFASGTGPSGTGATLGTFDPTLLTNGQYTLAIVAVDTKGLSNSNAETVVVQGAQKVGYFTTDDVTLTKSDVIGQDWYSTLGGAEYLVYPTQADQISVTCQATNKPNLIKVKGGKNQTLE